MNDNQNMNLSDLLDDDTMEDLRVTLTLDNDEDEEEEKEVYIYRYFEDEDGNPSLENIEDEEEYEAVSDRFEELLDEAEWDSLLDGE